MDAFRQGRARAIKQQLLSTENFIKCLSKLAGLVQSSSNGAIVGEDLELLHSQNMKHQTNERALDLFKHDQALPTKFEKNTKRMILERGRFSGS